MTRHALALSICLLTAFEAQGQTLSGRVLDAGTESPIPDVALRLYSVEGEPVEFKRTSDGDGGFVFVEVAPGRYRLEGERLGYRTTASGVLVVHAGDTIALEFRMAVAAIVLEPLTVTASARPWYEHLTPPALWEYYERRDYLSRLGRGHFMGPQEIRNLAGMPVALAIGTVPGMRAVASESSMGRFHLLGRQGCDALLFVNGHQVRLRAPLSRADTADVDFVPGPERLDWFVDDFVSLNEIEAIEVYRGAAELPGEFHGFSGNANCGAVIIWTKRAVARGGGEG